MDYIKTLDKKVKKKILIWRELDIGTNASDQGNKVQKTNAEQLERDDFVVNLK